jgi:hypothetical protein
MRRGILALGAALALAGCSPSPTSDDDAALVAGEGAADAAAEAAEKAAEAAADAADAAAAGVLDTPAAAATGWNYTSRENAMGDGKTSEACVTSDNEVQLGWPYGNTKADLCLRNSKAFGKDAYVALHGDGQILCRSYESCTLRIRYGDGKAQSISGIGASDNSTNIVFIQNRSSLERNLKTADKTAIEIEFYQAGRQALVFPTKGFDWKP